MGVGVTGPEVGMNPQEGVRRTPAGPRTNNKSLKYSTVISDHRKPMGGTSSLLSASESSHLSQRVTHNDKARGTQQNASGQPPRIPRSLARWKAGNVFFNGAETWLRKGSENRAPSETRRKGGKGSFWSAETKGKRAFSSAL